MARVTGSQCQLPPWSPPSTGNKRDVVPAALSAASRSPRCSARVRSVGPKRDTTAQAFEARVKAGLSFLDRAHGRG
jgi:hypothetical protein